MSDRRYTTSAWQKTCKAILQRDGYACTIRGPRCTGHATTVHHIPSSQRPDLFFASDDLAAACKACNSGGGRRIQLENQHTNLLQIAGAFERISQRVEALSERVTELERATGHTQSNGQALPTSRPVPSVY